MSKLYSLIKKVREEEDKEAMGTIISKFKPRIRSSLTQTSRQEREDMQQEVYIKIMEVVYKYDIESTPSIWELIDFDELSRRWKNE